MNIQQLQGDVSKLPQWWEAVAISIGGSLVMLGITGIIAWFWYSKKWRRFMEMLDLLDRSPKSDEEEPPCLDNPGELFPADEQDLPHCLRSSRAVTSPGPLESLNSGTRANVRSATYPMSFARVPRPHRRSRV